MISTHSTATHYYEKLTTLRSECSQSEEIEDHAGFRKTMLQQKSKLESKLSPGGLAWDAIIIIRSLMVLELREDATWNRYLNPTSFPAFMKPTLGEMSGGGCKIRTCVFAKANRSATVLRVLLNFSPCSRAKLWVFPALMQLLKARRRKTRAYLIQRTMIITMRYLLIVQQKRQLSRLIFLIA